MVLHLADNRHLLFYGNLGGNRRLRLPQDCFSVSFLTSHTTLLSEMSTGGMVRSFIAGKLSLVKPNDPVTGRVWQVVAHARYFIVRNDPCQGLWSPKMSVRPNQGSPKTGSTVVYFLDFLDFFNFATPLIVTLILIIGAMNNYV